MTARRISVRLFTPQAEALDELAEARGMSRSATLRELVLAATLPEDAPTLPDEQEVLELLGAAARMGSVPAMRELMAHHRERKVSGIPSPLAAVDELASKRSGP